MSLSDALAGMLLCIVGIPMIIAIILVVLRVTFSNEVAFFVAIGCVLLGVLAATPFIKAIDDQVGLR